MAITPGSVASASTSVALEILGRRIAATLRRCVPSGFVPPGPTTWPTADCRESFASIQMPGIWGDDGLGFHRGQFRQLFQTAIKNALITAELIDDEAPD